MPKESSIERIVGKIPEKHKELLLKRVENVFHTQELCDFAGNEREKTEEEKKVVNYVNEETNKVLEKYGLPSFDVPEKNVWIIPQMFWARKDTCAFFSPRLQAVLANETEYDCPGKNLILARRMYHEITHFKSYGALQVRDDKVFTDYRGGLSVYDRKESKCYLDNLNEAVTEELVKRFMERTMKNPPEFLEEEAGNSRKLFEKNKEMLKRNNITSDETSVLLKKGESLVYIGYAAQKERQIFNILLDKLYDKNRDKFQDREEVFDVFAKAMFTGNLLPVGRLVDGAFGEGTLRKIGELDKDMEKQKELVEGL